MGLYACFANGESMKRNSTNQLEAGEVLFNLLSSRNEVGSIIITSNLTLDKWNDVFKDQILTGAIVDRLACRSHLIDMSGESYRIKETKEWLDTQIKVA